MESVRNPYIYRIYQLCTNIFILTFIHGVCYGYILLLALADLSQCNKKSSGGGFHFYFTLSVKLFFPVRLDLMMQKRPLAVFLEQDSNKKCHIFPPRWSFFKKIISGSPESGHPPVSMISNFLGRVTTITSNYCLLSPGMCYKNIIQ